MLTAFLAVVAGAGTVVAPTASAQACPDVEVVFARGTVESLPPIGLTGLSFVEAVRSQLPGRSVAAYGVNYPASSNFGNRLAFAQTVVNGIDDTQGRIKFVAATCPRTRIVLGGYSQGAVVAGYAVGERVSLAPRYAQYASRVPAPLTPAVARHVAAVVLVAPPSARWLRDIGAPALRIGVPFADRTVRYCIPGDIVCDGAPVGRPNALHVLYSVNGMMFDAARFVAARV
ncbi:hypothetical protein GORHZ_120_00610 [Gordonia rhizosphera NBRC 16068]|uniref:Cutinase n=1 Tax=Gordonia rhizosphera NBRC 16068 TaxID=1108045 RepID=K6VVS4_9ACTN|nr:hypothetical protein GORHZ_120_00610 [Gordonia rhizosphera NBRC 16068]